MMQLGLGLGGLPRLCCMMTSPLPLITIALMRPVASSVGERKLLFWFHNYLVEVRAV